jgi:hypothetical protein
VRNSRNQIILPTNDKKQRMDGSSGFSIRCFLLFAVLTCSWADWGNMINWLIFPMLGGTAFSFLTFGALVGNYSRHSFSDGGCLPPWIVLIGDELELLVTLIELYEEKHFPMDLPDPLTAIKFRMEQQNLKKGSSAESVGENK